MYNAQELTRILNGTWHGRYGTAPCPVCQPERRKDQTALTIGEAPSTLLAHCKKSECSFSDILRAAAGHTELSGPGLYQAQPSTRENKQAIARSIWQKALPINASIAERYLQGRGISHSSPKLRFAPRCWHRSGQHLPAMVARIDGPEGLAVHRTYLAPDGSAKAEIQPSRAMLGPVAGGAVRLEDGNGPLIVGEGIENVLSYLEFSDRCYDAGTPCTVLNKLGEYHLGTRAAWAALSASGLCKLELPRVSGSLIIAADPDNPGMSAAYDLAHRANVFGWAVYIDVPADGEDWNAFWTSMDTAQ